jgi:hypothetical protein
MRRVIHHWAFRTVMYLLCIFVMQFVFRLDYAILRAIDRLLEPVSLLPFHLW